VQTPPPPHPFNPPLQLPLPRPLLPIFTSLIPNTHTRHRGNPTRANRPRATDNRPRHLCVPNGRVRAAGAPGEGAGEVVGWVCGGGVGGDEGGVAEGVVGYE